MLREPRIEDRDTQPYASIAVTVPMSSVAATLPPLIGEVFGWLAEHEVPPAGAPFFKYNVVDMEGDLEVEVGVPVATTFDGDGRVVADTLAAGNYVVATHVGPYDRLVDSTTELLRWAEDQGLTWDVARTGTGHERWGARLEIYESDPDEVTDPEHLETVLAFRLAAESANVDQPAGATR